MKKRTIAAVFLTVMSSTSVFADQVIQDDLIVTGSACIGPECVEGITFGFDTLQLVSPNPVINFIDTSASSRFPTTDWRLGVADSSRGISYLFITDKSSDVEVLKLEASENGGVALGAGALLEDNAVSVGSPTQQRRVTYVADGIEPTDGVNMAQLKQLEATFEPKVSELEQGMATLLNRLEALNARLDELQ